MPGFVLIQNICVCLCVCPWWMNLIIHTWLTLTVVEYIPFNVSGKIKVKVIQLLSEIKGLTVQTPNIVK